MKALKWLPCIILTTPLRLEIVQLPKSAFLQVRRVYLALHPDGVVIASWDVDEDKREYPHIQLVGWKPKRDVPFRLPVRFERNSSPHVTTLIPRGAWVLPYEETLYLRYKALAAKLEQVYREIDLNPHMVTFTLDEDGHFIF